MSSQVRSIIIWVLAIVLMLVFVVSGLQKLMGTELQVQNFKAWQLPDWMRYPIGALNVILGILIIVPATRWYGAVLVFPWTLAAVITHLQAHQLNQIFVPLLFSALAAGILWLREQEEDEIEDGPVSREAEPLGDATVS